MFASPQKRGFPPKSDRRPCNPPLFARKRTSTVCGKRFDRERTGEPKMARLFSLHQSSGWKSRRASTLPSVMALLSDASSDAELISITLGFF
jgi:hypothetical protein